MYPILHEMSILGAAEDGHNISAAGFVSDAFHPQKIRSQRLTKTRTGVKLHPRAEVAELADALRSGRSEHTLMWVQVPPSAQFRSVSLSQISAEGYFVLTTWEWIEFS